MDGDSVGPVDTAEPKPPKRQGPGDQGPRRPKRGKYTPVACDECKKRKLKCLPVDNAKCERCIAGGLACTYSTGPSQATRNKGDSQQVRNLSEEMAQLRRQVADLIGTVTKLKDTSPRAPSVSSQSQDTTLIQSPSTGRDGAAPKQPQFVGPTRPTFGLMVGERSLTRMGIPRFESPPPSRGQSPTSDPPRETTSEVEFWHHCTADEVARLLSVFEEVVESVYPFADIVELSSRSQQILDRIRSRRPSEALLSEAQGLDAGVTQRDVEMAKLAMATAIVIETSRPSELSKTIAQSVELQVSRISSPEVELKEIQLLTMLSIFYFHSDDELLAWRTIGIAAREALEMGLHRRKSLFDNFKDPASRRLAMRVFWCVYVLDRRWSFGTSLSFALADRDIDPGLPEPDADFSYLKCMVGYARLGSKLWDAIPPLGSPSQTIPEETVNALDLCTQDWFDSIPSHLRLRHPRLGLAARSQPRVLQRLRALLYLRGNHTRISIYQHYLLSPASITANLRCAWLVVDIAQDSLQVLVHLNATTDIYSRQQNAFNYFLLSALAIIFLAVCHAPSVFAEPCRKVFLDAVDLVRGFSRHGGISRRLWKTIRGLLPRLRSLGLQGSEGGQNDVVPPPAAVVPPPGAMVPPAGEAGPAPEFREGPPHPMREDAGVAMWEAQAGGDMVPDDADLGGSVPDMFQMRNDLLDLFDALGQGQQFPGEFGPQFYGGDEADLLNQGSEISRRLQGLI